MNALNAFEITILDAFQNLRCGFLDTVLPVITHLAEKGWFWILVAVVLLFFKKTRKAGIMMGIALTLGLALGNGLIKNLVARIRPYDFNEAMKSQLLVPVLSDYSFPSGHSLASFEAAGVLMMTHRKMLGWPALVIAILIALSRLYLYVHYPSDVLAGVLLGLLFAWIAYLVVNRAEKAYKDYRAKKAAAAENEKKEQAE